MKKQNSNFLSTRLSAVILGGLLILAGFAGFYLFDVSAEKKVADKPTPGAAENLVNGRLAFVTRQSGPTAPERRIITSNPDATGQATVPISTSLEPNQPSWSPDGTKIAFNSSNGMDEIYSTSIDGTSGVINLTNTAHPVRESHPSWSSTGKIAYERDGKIWVMNEDGSGQMPFPGITENAADPAWSPDGSKLAYSTGGIWIINADGTNKQQITVGSDPAWSPDGSKIVFKGGGGISAINVDGTNETLLANGSGFSGPAWSPDGTKIAFYGGGIKVMNSDGSNQITIISNVIRFPTCCDTLYEYPAWQPVEQVPNTFSISGRIADLDLPVSGVTVNLSGTVTAATTTDAVGNYQFSGLPAGGNYRVSPSFLRHYFTPANNSFSSLTSNQTADFEVLGVCRGGQCVKNGKIAYTRSGDIYVMNPDGSNKINITNMAGIDTEPNYSPDGLSIAFTTDRDGNSEIYRMDEDGFNPVRLTNNAAADSSPYHSPDGTSIVFVSQRDGNREIYKMNSDGSNQVRLTNNDAEDSNPAFAPDGQKILFASRRLGKMRLFTMNTDGSDPQLVPDEEGFIPLYERPSYSPDGSKIIVTYTPFSTGEFPLTHTMNTDGTNRAEFSALGVMGSYSPDGLKVVYACCEFDVTNPYRIRTAKADGTSVQNLMTSGTGYDLPDWQPIVTRRAPFDFDGDGRSDTSVFRPANRAWYINRSADGLWVPVWGLSSDILVPADYDGDLKTDVAVWRPSEGDFYVLNSFDFTVRIENLGLAGDIPTGGDWDGDGKADPAVYRDGSGQSTFYYRGSQGNPQGNITFIPWGLAGDKPVASDYDGDGRTDAAIYRDGVWYVNQSSDGQLFAAQFGLANDVVNPADYDGDGKTDLAVYRDGIWYLLQTHQGFSAFQFGIAGDVPVPADYDGDGRADASVYRDGVWWTLNSQSGSAIAFSFGLGTDTPVPSVYNR